MDQELRLEQKNQQLSTILSIVQKYVDKTKLDTIFEQIESFFPEMDFYNSVSFKRAFPDYKAKNKQTKKRNSLVGVWKERQEIANEKAESTA